MFYYQTISIIIYIVFLWLTILAVGLRYFARRITRISFGADDWLALIALVLNIGVSVYAIASIYIVHYEDLINKIDIRQYLKVTYIDAVMAIAITGIIKCSVIIFYKRIFETRTFKIVANIVLAICVAYLTAGVLTYIFHSWPISDYWNDDTSNIDFGMMSIIFNVLDLVLDLLVLSLPLAMIRKLHLNRKKRIGVAAIFGLGIICVITISVRLPYFIQLSNIIDNPVVAAEDPEQATIICDAALLWTHLECSISIITACLPTLVPVFTKLKAIAPSFNLTRIIKPSNKKLASIVSSDRMGLKRPDTNEKDGSLQQESEVESRYGGIKATTVISVF